MIPTYSLSGDRLRCTILNAHTLLGKTKRFKGGPLWAIVSELTGHGSTISCEICADVGLDSCHKCGKEYPR